MTTLTLSPDQHRSLWHKLAMLREAHRELKSVKDARRIIGAGSLTRRREDAEATIGIATDELASILESAAQQTEGHQ